MHVVTTLVLIKKIRVDTVGIRAIPLPVLTDIVVPACFFLTHMYHRKISRTSPNIELLQTKYVNNGVPMTKPLKRKMHIVGIGCNLYFL